MSKYHISPTTGHPNKCTATKRPCPVEGDHFDTKEEARAAYEAQMGGAVPDGQTKGGERSVEDVLAEWKEQRALRTDEAWVRTRDLEEELKNIMPPPPSPEELMASIHTPAGFTRTEDAWERHGWGGEAPRSLPQLILESPDVKILINFSDNPDDYMLADGHVSFNSAKGWRTFDRHEVEDSFYIDNPRKNFSLEDPTSETNATIQDFLERKIPESQARIAGSESVPGIAGRLVTAKQKAQLLEKGVLQLIPGGFGTGYAFSTSPIRGGQEASAEQKAFFGSNSLWVSTFDCD